MKVASHHLEHGEALQRSTVWRVGCGDKIKLWEDDCIGDSGALATKYPRLYLISSQQNHTIQHMGVHNDSGWEW